MPVSFKSKLNHWHKPENSLLANFSYVPFWRGKFFYKTLGKSFSIIGSCQHHFISERYKIAQEQLLDNPAAWAMACDSQKPSGLWACPYPCLVHATVWGDSIMLRKSRATSAGWSHSSSCVVGIWICPPTAHMDALHAEVHRGHRCSSRTLIWTRSPRGKKGGSDTDTDKGGSGYSLGEKELSAGCTLPEVNIAAVGTD